MDRIYAPGCALTNYKPHLAEKMHELLSENLREMERLDTCCRNHPPLRGGVQMINTCPGCDRRYTNNYTDSTTKSVWEVIAEGDWFQFPDYHGARMSIHDACPTRDQTRVHKAIRTLLGRMNIEVVEPQKTGTTATCCGDSLYPNLPVEEVNEAMRRRASEMPVEDVVVYCVSCVKSMFIGGKRPRYMVDLLFGEETVSEVTDTVEWHRQVDDYTRSH